MSTKFHSKVVRVKTMGGKVLVEFKEKFFDNTDEDIPSVDTSVVEMYDDSGVAEVAIKEFMQNG